MERDRQVAPVNFRWIVNDRLSVSGLPQTPASLQWLKDRGIQLVIHLCEEHPPDERLYRQAGLELYYSPVSDYCAPTSREARLIVSKINTAISGRRPVHVCCRSGVGRAPTVAAMYLVSISFTPEAALNRVGMWKAGGYGNPSQRNAVHKLAQQLSHRFVFDVRIE